MTPKELVVGLLASVRETAGSTADYLAAPPVKHPSAHLGKFAEWYQRLSSADQEVAREVIRYASESSLFVLLTHLDNLAAVTDEPGELELWHAAPDDSRTRLNDTDGELLTDLFNSDAAFG